ncbi:hypothetical protein AGMMS49944_27960 [Spirochaetia bacterium]|nr:hypothetical protein AGMMS49944_27960 [Spirochaetia bacterium]
MGNPVKARRVLDFKNMYCTNRFNPAYPVKAPPYFSILLYVLPLTLSIKGNRALGVSCNYAITVESDTVADEEIID